MGPGTLIRRKGVWAWHPGGAILSAHSSSVVMSRRVARHAHPPQGRLGVAPGSRHIVGLQFGPAIGAAVAGLLAPVTGGLSLPIGAAITAATTVGGAYYGHELGKKVE